jgi:hypothetical protein
MHEATMLNPEALRELPARLDGLLPRHVDAAAGPSHRSEAFAEDLAWERPEPPLHRGGRIAGWLLAAPLVTALAGAVMSVLGTTV